jgi:hypothetical protein
MKTTTILSIVAIVAAVAAAGLVTTVSFSTPAHAAACSIHHGSPGKPQSGCSSSESGTAANAFIFNDHLQAKG